MTREFLSQQQFVAFLVFIFVISYYLFVFISFDWSAGSCNCNEFELAKTLSFDCTRANGFEHVLGSLFIPDEFDCIHYQHALWIQLYSKIFDEIL